MATLFSRSEKEMACAREVVIWNYFDHEHVVGTHYKNYSRFKIIAEKDNWSLVERFYRLPIIGLHTSSHGFMFLENPHLIRSFQYGLFTMEQSIHIEDLGPERCLVSSEYRLTVPFFMKPLEPLWRQITARWFVLTWDEDAPMRRRRQKVWQLGFRNFVGIDYINDKTAQPADRPSARRYPVELPVPKTPGHKDGVFERPFAHSVEVGYPDEE